MKTPAATLLVALLYVLHQDFWFWRAARPLVFGILPIGLFYHAAYTLATSLVLWLLVLLIWPGHLEQEPGARSQEPGTGDQGPGATNQGPGSSARDQEPKTRN